MSYGSKATAQVIKDIMFKQHSLSDIEEVEHLTDEEKNKILKEIYHFIDTTLENSVEELTQTIEEIKEKVRNFTEKTEE